MQTAIARDSARAGISAFNWRAYAARILEKSASFKARSDSSPKMTADESGLLLPGSVGRQCELKYRAALRAGGYPESAIVPLDDRSGNR